MKHAIVLHGIPGSGKTTLARSLVAEDETLLRVNRDDIRSMLGGEHSERRESVVRQIRDAVVEILMDYGYGVVVDDTNLGTEHPVKIREDALVDHVWLATPVDECVRRDALRPEPLGEDTIRRTAAKHGLS